MEVLDKKGVLAFNAHKKAPDPLIDRDRSYIVCLVTA